ncbi:MAG: pullulanase, partial [Bacteroidota bacterium]
VQRWLIDQCQHFIKEFGIDGFRVDLAGQIDRQTLSKLRQAVGPDIILYGEPWIGSSDPAYESNPSWDWYKHNSPITYFQDESRNAFQGSPFELYDKHLHRGYAGGNFRLKDKAKAALSANFPEDYTPLNGISYIDIHDNWTLADRFAQADWNGLKGVEEARYKIATLLLYTSLGPIVTHGGSEIMRSKGLAPIDKSLRTMEDGTRVFFKGRGDTYNVRTPNQFLWETVGQKSKKGSPDYAGMQAFWRGLNHFRLSEYGKVFRQAERVSPDHYRWLDTVNPYQLGYLVDEKVLVLLNVGSEFHDWDEVYLPPGSWKLVGNLSGVDHQNGIKDKQYGTLTGGQSHRFRLDGPSFMMWVRE